MPTLYETHYGIVTDNNDEEHRGRLKVKSQSLVGADYELPEWVEPSNPLFTSKDGGGSLFLPLVGSTVELDVAITDSEFDQIPCERFLQNPSVKWRYGTHTESAGGMPLPDDLLTNYPNRRGWVTPGGHKMIFDDDGSIIIESNHGHLLEFKDGQINLKPSGKSVLTSPTELGEGATELIILGNVFMSLFNAHTHPTGVGPSGPPTTPMTASHLSAEGNKVK